MKNKLYKVTGPNGEPIHGGKGNWFLPVEKQPGKWMPLIEDIEPCKAGYHLVDAKHILSWPTSNCIIWEAEYKGKIVYYNKKYIAAQARLTKKIKALTYIENALFVADCVEHVEHIYAKNTKDDSVKKLIQIQRDLAHGKITHAEYDRKRCVVGRRSTKNAKSAAWAIRFAVWYATETVPWIIARDAAQIIAENDERDVEKKWQLDKLYEYLGLASSA